jgi:UrcA family protein
MSIHHCRHIHFTTVMAGLFAAFMLQPARAAEPGTVRQIVDASDLDLRSAAGQATLNHRIAIAALQVCEVALDGDLLSDCPWQARKRAGAQVNALAAGASPPAEIAVAGPTR